MLLHGLINATPNNVKCSTHYRDTNVDHRCFIGKDKHRRESDDSDGETLSEGDLNVMFFNKVEGAIQEDKRQKLGVESRHYAYDMESMLLCTPQRASSLDSLPKMLGFSGVEESFFPAYIQSSG